MTPIVTNVLEDQMIRDEDEETKDVEEEIVPPDDNVSSYVL